MPGFHTPSRSAVPACRVPLAPSRHTILRQRNRSIAPILLVLILLGLTGVTSESLAQSPRLQGQGTAGSGMGNAFTAQADDPSAVHYNPAGLSQLNGVQIMAGGLGIGGRTNFSNAAGVGARGDRNGSMAWPSPGHFYLSARLNDLGVTSLGDVTVALGLNSPYGSLTRWPSDGPFRTSVTFVTLPLLDIKPTLAYKLNDQWSFGVGADIYTFSGLFGEGHAERKFVWPGGLGIAPGSQMELAGKDTAAGFNVSVLYTPFRNGDGKPLTNIGVVYRSQATLHLGGSLLANGAAVTGAQATLVLPQVFSFGAAIWPVRTSSHEWKFEFDADYVGWKSIRNLDISLTNGATILQPQNWQNGYSVMIGTEYRMLQLESLPHYEVALRAGYTNQQTQMPDATFDPGIASSNAHIPGVGIGFLCKEQGSFLGLFPCGSSGTSAFLPKAIGLDLSYQLALYEDRTVVGNRNPTVNGTYKTSIHAGGFSVRMIF